jgi:hypothetical protein
VSACLSAPASSSSASSSSSRSWSAPSSRRRRPTALVLAVALPDDRAAADSTARPTAAAAAQTVRAFLATAVLDDDAYEACQYLTPAAQAQVARAAGAGQTCRDALSAAPPSFVAIRSEGELHALAVRAVVTAPALAKATIARPGQPPVALVLRRATAADEAAYAAPQCAWRIASARPAL